MSVNWTDWSVDSSDCQEYCSEKGGTVTASRQCYSHLETLEEKVCTRHNNSTKVVKCAEHCPVSGLFHDLFHVVRKDEGWELIPHIDHTLKKSPLNFFLNNGTQALLDNVTTRCLDAFKTKMRVNVNRLDCPRDQDLKNTIDYLQTSWNWIRPSWRNHHPPRVG